jgi:hypothetical protein
MRTIIIALVCALALLSGARTFAANFTTIADTYTDQAADKAGTNFGLNGITAVSRTRITLVRFNPAQVAQSTGGTALLNMKVLLAKSQSNGVAVRLVLAPWNENTVTANTMPAISPSALDQRTITTADQGKSVSFNVSAALAQWRSDPASNFGLALVPIAPLPNLQLGSREGGSPAVLAVSGATQDNDVTVAPSGADYTSPAAAANNAFEGDKWCVSPSHGQHCTIHVAAGTYFGDFALPGDVDLLGDGKGETLIFGGLRVDGFGSLISDLTIIAAGVAIDGHLEGSARLERVSVRATLRVPDSAAFVGAGVTLVDSEVAVEAGDPHVGALAFDCIGGCGGLNIVRSDISVVAREFGATMVAMEDGPSFTNVDVEDSTLYVHGKSEAAFLRSADEDNQLLRFVRTRILVSSPGDASGFSSGHFFMRGFTHLDFIDSKINVDGGTGGTFIDWEAGHIVFDGTVVDSTTAVAKMAFGQISVLRSQLTASQTVLDARGADVDIETSYLRGGTAVRANVEAISPFQTLVHAKSAVIAGQLTLGDGVSATCDHVYDQNFALRRPDCSSP